MADSVSVVDNDFVVIVPSTGAYVVVPEAYGLKGDKGDKGDPGTGTIDDTALHIAQQLSEFDTQAAKQAARVNLELDPIDGGTFF